MLSVRDLGEGNVVELAAGVAEAMGGEIVVRGNRNRVRIAAGCSGLEQVYFDLGDDNEVDIGEAVSLGHLYLHAARGARVVVGAASGFNGRVRLLLHEPARIDIGAGCLFAGEVDLTVSDMHSIVDLASGKRINPPADIHIADRVWVGQGSLVLKGARLGEGCVVGAGSVVGGALPANTVSAGRPARVLREGATWDFRLLPFDDEPAAPEPPRAGWFRRSRTAG